LKKEQTMERAVPFDLLDPGAFANPYPVYAQMRAAVPVYWSDQIQSWVLTRYDDVLALARDPRLATGWRQLPMGRPLTPEEQDDIREIERLRISLLGSLNGQDHLRQRTLVQAAYTPRVVEQMRGFIQAKVDALIDGLALHGRMDFIRDIALPLPLAVTYYLIGVPPEFQETVKAGADALLDSLFLHNPPPGQIGALLRLAKAGEQRVREMIAQRRAQPQDDLLSQMLHASQDGQRLREDELCTLVYTLVLAGFETTVNLLGNGMLALLTHPDQLARLRAEPQLIESAVEELLRFDTPALCVARTLSEDVQVRDVTLRRGQMAMLMIGAANHDPEQFPDPERVDLARTPNRLLSFGQGPHYCFGAALARLEAQILFCRLLERLPGLRLDTAPETLEWLPSMIMRGLKALPLRFDPAL
jgi:cytochrome P450